MNNFSNKFLLFFFGMFMSTAGQSSVGSDWLADQSLSNGSIMTADSTGFPYLATAESLKSFVMLGESNRPEILNGRNFLSTGRNDELFLKTQHLATQAITGLYEVALLDDVIASVNLDGGLGALIGYQSNALNTASFLEALKYAQSQDQSAVGGAIQYLLDIQNGDGGYSYPGDNQSDIVLTSYVSSVLQLFKGDYQLTDEIAETRNFILDARINQIAWGDDWKTAWALIALAGSEPDRNIYQSAINELQQNQDVNGSWQNDTYTTALSLRALAMVDGLTVVPPDGDAALFGQAIDETSGLPLKDVRFELSGTSLLTVFSNHDGEFYFNQIETGDYTLTTQKDGYQARIYQISIQSQQSLDLGDVLLKRQPDQGILRGVASDATTGLPITNATITIDGGSQPVAYTDIDGSYEVALPGNEITIEAAKDGFQTVTASGVLVAGQILEFSPSMIPDGDTAPTFADVNAQVVDFASGTPLSGVNVLLDTGESLVTAADGLLIFSGLDIQTIEITLSKANYLNQVYNVLLQPGVNELGQIRLKEISIPTTSTLSGQVLDAATGSPVVNAVVNLPVLGLGTVSDADGNYVISGINQLNFNVTLSANGYQSLTNTVTLQGHGNVSQNFELSPLQGNDISLIEITSTDTSYQAFKDVNVLIELANSGSLDTDVRLYVRVFNDQGELVESYPKVLLGLGSTLQDALETVPANGGLNTEVKWPTRQNAPGWYDIVVEFFDSSDTTLLLQGSVEVEILPTRKIGGIAEFDPPITTFHAREEVAITAEVANRGNLPIDGGEITANVKLLNKGYQRVKPEASWLNASEDKWASRSRMDRASDGSIYISNLHQLYKKADAHSEGELFYETSRTYFYIDDVDVASDGTIWLMESSRLLVQLDSDGTVIQSIETGISSVYSIEALSDRILIANSSSLYQYTWDGLITEMNEATVSNPGDTTVSTDGVLYICGQQENQVYKYENNIFSLWRDDLISPVAISSDSSGSIYVAQFTQDNVIKIDRQGNRTAFVEMVDSPDAIYWDENENQLYVHSKSERIIYKADGVNQAEPVTKKVFDMPNVLTVDNDGTRYFADNTGQLMSLSADNTINNYLDEPIFARDIIQNDSNLLLLERNNLKKVSKDFTQVDLLTDQLVNGQAVARSNEDDGYFIVQGSNSGIMHLADDGTLSEVLASTRNAQKVVYDSIGSQYILDAGRKITKIDVAGKATGVSTNISYIQSIAIDSSDNLYMTSYFDKAIIKLSPSGTQETIATFSFIPQFLVIDNSDQLFVSQQNSGLVYSVDSSGAALNVVDFGSRLSFMEIDNNSNLWAKTASRQVSQAMSDGSIVNYATTQTVYSLLPIENNGFLYGAYKGVFKVADDGTEEPYLFTDPLDRDYVYNMHINSSNELLIHTYYRNFLKFDHQNNLLLKGKTLYNPTDILTFNDAIYVLMAEGIYIYDSDLKWGEEVLAGRFTHIEINNSGQLYYQTSNALYEFDFNTQESVLINSGINGIVGFDIDSNALFHTVNTSQNQYQKIDASGAVIDQFYSHRTAYEIVKTPTNDLLISSILGKTFKSRADGLLDFFINDFGTDMIIKNNQVVFNSSNQLKFYDLNTLTLTERLTPGVSGMSSIALNDDDIYLTTTYGLFNYDFINDAERVVGMERRFFDIESDAQERVYMSANRAGSLVELLPDNSTVLLNGNIPNINTLHIEGDKILTSSASELRLISEEQEDSFTKPIFLNSIMDALIDGDNLFVLAITVSNEYKTTVAVFENGVNEVEVGDIVYTKRGVMPSLFLDQPSEYLDFGSFTPPVSGDYQVEFEFPSIENSLANTLHVGNASFATITLETNEVLPGDRSLNLNVNVVGADDASITQIDTDNILLNVESRTNGRAIAADSRGNVYSATTNSIVKITSDGNISDVVTGMSVGNGLAADSSENLYFSSSAKLMKLDSNEIVTEMLTAPRTIQAIAVNSQNELFFATSAGLYKANNDNSYESFSTLSNFNIKAIAIDVNDEFNLLDYAHGIYKLDKNGSYLTKVVNRTDTDIDLTFEYEGVNLIADCSDNILFAPFRFGLFDYVGEESIIVQRTGLTGEYSQILYGPSIDSALNDMDVLYYDKINSRIMIWTDRNNGKIFSFPVVCGGIDVELHLTPLEQVNVSNFATTPSQIEILANGDQNLVWALESVGSVGVDIDLNLDFLSMQEAESRPALKSAKLVFKNTFRPDEDIEVPIDIPNLLARSRKTLDISLNMNEFVENSDVGMTLDVYNGHDDLFDGYIKLIIEDDAGFIVDNIPTLIVNDVNGFENQLLLQQWNTGLNLTGGYRIRAELYNESDVFLDDALASFSVISDVFTAQVETRIMSDKHEYRTNDQVLLSGMVKNITQNALHPASTAILTVSSPSGAEVLNVSYDLDEIYANANRQLSHDWPISAAEPGTYTVMLVDYDDDQNIYHSSSNQFDVVEVLANDIAANVTVSSASIYQGQELSCTDVVENIGDESLVGVEINQLLIGLPDANIIDTQVQNIDLNIGEQVSLNRSDVAVDLTEGSYACVLEISYLNEILTPAPALFNVLKYNTISGQIWHDRNQDQIIDVDETGLEILVELYDSQDQLLTSVTSDNLGQYQFSDVEDGNYTVKVINGEWQLTTAEQISVDLSQADAQADFGLLWVQGGVNGFVWADNNNNATLDVGEIGLADVTIQLTGPEGQVTDVSTDAQGQFVIGGLITGDYQLSVNDVNQILVGSVLTTANQPFEFSVLINQPDIPVEIGYQFSNAVTQQLIFNDLNGNGVQDTGEIGMAGVSVELLQDNQLINTQVSDANGQTQFTQLPAGSYTINITDTSGVLTTSRLTTGNLPYGINLSANEIDTSGVFGYQFPTSNIEGLIFNDTNGNGLQDQGEIGLPDVTVDLIRNNQVISTELTDANGLVTFNQLFADSYILNITDTSGLLSGASITTGTLPHTISLATDQTDTSGVFGYQFSNASIENSVFNDTNGNGVQDIGEAGLAGVSIDLIKSGQVEATQTTDVDGQVIFDGLVAAEYTVSVTDTANVISDAQLTTSNLPYQVTLSDGQVDNAGIFGYQFASASIQNSVFNDTNGNGVQDTGEVGLAGVSIDLIKSGQVEETLMTNVDGQVIFDGLVAAEYTVSVTDTANVLTDAQLTTSNLPYQVTLSDGQVDNAGIFGYQFASASIQNTVFNDTNSNGVQDTGEAGLAGVSIDLINAGQVEETLMTDVDGQVIFDGLVAAEYSVSVTDTANVLADAQITTSNLPYQVTLSDGQIDNAGIFGYQFASASIQNAVFNDTNGNGVQDTGEAGLVGVTVDLIKSGQVEETLMTDVDGQVIFDGLVAAEYTVSVTDTANVLTDAQLTTANLPYVIDLATSQLDVAGVFGYLFVDASIAGLIFEDVDLNGQFDLDENALSNINVDLMQDGQLIQSQLTDSDGLFVFIGLSAGDYQVLVNDAIIDPQTLTTDNQPLDIILTSSEINDSSQIGFASTINQCESDLLNASEYNVMTWDDFSATSSDVQGRMAVGGDVSINHYSIGDQLDVENAGDVLVAGGNISFPSGQVYFGNVIAVGSTDGIGSPVINGMHPGATISEYANLPIDFSVVENVLKQQAVAFSQMTTNTTFESQWGGLYLHGDCQSDRQVFNLDGTEVLNAHTFEVDCIPDGATVLFNISGTHTGLTNMSLSTLSTHSQRVLFNFYEAEQLTLAGIGVEGSVLAPFADIDNPQGVIHGQLIANSWNGMMQVNHNPFIGKILNNECPENSPPPIWADSHIDDDALDWSGSENQVIGGVHSNSGIKLGGSDNSVNGRTEWVTTFDNSGSNNLLIPAPTQVDVKPWPYPINLADYQPGGSIAISLEQNYHDKSQVCNQNGKWESDVQGNQLDSGLYWVPCDVVFNGSNLNANYTVISTGKIEISGSSQSEFNAYINNLLFWTNYAGSDAVKLSGSNSTLSGAILAPNGLLEASGSNMNLSCGLAGNKLKLNGSNLYIDLIGCEISNQPPVALNQAVTTPVNTPIDFILSGGDPNGDALIYNIQTQPTFGMLSGQLPELTYSPSTDYVGPDQLTFITSDGSLDSPPAIVTFDVTEIQSACALYPYTIDSNTIAGLQTGDTVNNYSTGVGSGNYSLLTWDGSNDTPTLATSFTQPGDSENYLNPDDGTDHILNINDWVQGVPGKKNGQAVRAAIDDLIGQTISVPVWSETRGNGSNHDYLVSEFIDIVLTDYKLNGNSYISFEYLGQSSCVNQPVNKANNKLSGITDFNDNLTKTGAVDFDYSQTSSNNYDNTFKLKTHPFLLGADWMMEINHFNKYVVSENRK